MNRKIKTYVFVHIHLFVLQDRSLSLTTNYSGNTINQLSNDSLDNVFIDEVLASVSFICSSSVIVKVE